MENRCWKRGGTLSMADVIYLYLYYVCIYVCVMYVCMCIWKQVINGKQLCVIIVSAIYVELTVHVVLNVYWSVIKL